MTETADSFAGQTGAGGGGGACASATPAALTFTPQSRNPLQPPPSSPQVLPPYPKALFDEGPGSGPPPFLLFHTDPPVLDRSHSYCEAMDYCCDPTTLNFRQQRQQQQQRRQKEQQQLLSAAVADVLQQVAHLTVEGNHHSDEDKDANDNDEEDWRLEKWTWSGGTGDRTLGACIEGGGAEDEGDTDGVGATAWGIPPPSLAWQTPPARLPSGSVGSVGTTSLHSAAAAAAAEHYSSQSQQQPPPPSAHQHHHKRMLSGSSSMSGAHALWNPYSWSSSFSSSPYPTASLGSSSKQWTQQEQQFAHYCPPQGHHQHRSVGPSHPIHNTIHSSTTKKQRSGSFLLVQTAPHLPLSPELPDDLPTPLIYDEEVGVDGQARPPPPTGAGGAPANGNDDEKVGEDRAIPSGCQPHNATANAGVRYHPPRRPLHFPPPLFSPLRWAATPQGGVVAPPLVLPSAVLPGVDADSGVGPTRTPSVPDGRLTASSVVAATPQQQQPLLLLPPPPPMPLMTSPSPPTRRQILRMRRADAIRLAL